MRDQVVPLARRALDTLSEKYQFKPTGPILVEMFPKHDDFAVRTIGLPGFVGALGACFGKVVTLDSPRARPPGTFSWTATLWHELAHVISLQMSNNRVPRWVSEGISQFEERRARPEWGRETEIPFARALEDGKVPKIRDINESFNDPELWSLLYRRVVARHRASRGHVRCSCFGLVAAAQGYGKGLETEEAFKAAFNATIDEIQVSFDARLTRDYASLRAAMKTPEIPEGATVDQAEGRGHQQPGQLRGADAAGPGAQRSRRCHGGNRGAGACGASRPGGQRGGDPYAAIALNLPLKQGDTARAIRALEAVIKVESADVEAARKLASLVAPLGDEARDCRRSRRGRGRARPVRRTGSSRRRQACVGAT